VERFVSWGEPISPFDRVANVPAGSAAPAGMINLS